MRTIIDCYKELPEAKNIPDSVWECYKIRQYIDELNKQSLKALQDLYVASDKMLNDLKKDWTEEEIDKTGMRDCI